MPHAYLPKRKSGTGNRFPDPQAAGVWEERPTQLNHLAEAIEIPSEPQRIYSIPDAWARALLFDRALFDENHKLHPMVLGEWSGLLALIGLRERRNFESLTVHPITLDSSLPNSFSAVLAQLVPQDENMLSPESNWQQFYILRWQLTPWTHNNPRAFAFTSPMTLVSTGADYSGLISSDEVPWFDGERLTDPADHLATRERRALAEWILALSRELTRQITNTVRKSRIVDLVNDFAHRLDATAKAPSNPEDVLSTNVYMGLHDGIYRALDRPLKSETSNTSDVQIITSKPTAPTYYLIEPSLSQQWQLNAKDILIFGDVHLATADRYTNSGQVQGTMPGGQNWATSGFFFQNRLIYLRDGGVAFPGCLPVSVAGDPKKRSIVLPLSEEVLKLFTPKEIQESFSVAWQPNGGALCSLRLRLKTSSGKERTCRIQKTYNEADMVLVEDLPLITIWPNFRISTVNWQAYYTFEMWSSQKRDELKVKPWADDEREPAANRFQNLDQRHFEVSFTHKYPEALICSTPYVDLDNHSGETAKGLLLINQPEVLSPPAMTRVTLGVDFGSTGSGIYQRFKGDPKPVVFKNRLHQITGYDPKVFSRFTRELFIPARDWSADEILSVFQDFGDPKEGPNARVVLRDGHVLYTEDPRTFISGDRKRVKSNLKWGDQSEKIAARDFLRQICLQSAAEIAVEGCTTADLRYSYPTAFSDGDIANLEATWDRVVDDLEKQTGIEFRVNPTFLDPVTGEEKPADNREAITATKFFCDYAGEGNRMDITGGAVTVDIGGGTTDMAVWNRMELVSHSSVVFAGRDIFLNPLRKNPSILSEIDPRVSHTIEELLKTGEKDAAYDAHLEAIISKHGKELIDGLHLQESEGVKGFLSILETGLCGIGFYAGLLVRRVQTAAAFKAGRRVAIFAGGNGSKIFRWCALGRLTERSEIHQRFSKAFLNAADLKNTKIEIRLSEKPKSEVAYGLVCQDLPLRVKEDFAKPIAGEAYMIGETEQPWDSSPPAEEIRKRNVMVDRKFPVFQQFLEALDETADEDLLDRLGGQVDLRLTMLSQEVANAQQRDKKKRKDENLLRNEPIFIIALKAYLAMRIEEWARRA
ncbi:MAG TPA: hypothetical protein VKU19_19170 [Bryobacteraceae bacterium]|nr:hypothetical protein [Bryobacteraceae bacterium]